MGCALLGTLLTAGRSAAQDARGRLTVRPCEMATGTRTEKTGVFPMPEGKLYVPPKCVGTRRCPLWVLLPHFASLSVEKFHDEDVVINRLARRGVDEFGILLLVTRDPYKTDALDTTMKQVLAQFAVDPNQIAVGNADKLVSANPDVFSRLVILLGAGREPLRSPQLEVFFSIGITEYDFGLDGVARQAELRAQGYPAKYLIGLHGHGASYYNGYEGEAAFYFAARWLDESWRIADPAKRSQPAVVTNPLPLLTPKVMTQMITFWESFQQEPDSIRGAVRQKYLREVLVPVGLKEAPPFMAMVDMAALAAAVPSVAAKLEAAGFTAQQHDAYRVALLSAIFLAAGRNPVIKARRHPSLIVDGESIMGKNMAFVLAHPDELLVLEQTAIWMIP